MFHRFALKIFTASTQVLRYPGHRNGRLHNLGTETLDLHNPEDLNSSLVPPKNRASSHSLSKSCNASSYTPIASDHKPFAFSKAKVVL